MFGNVAEIISFLFQMANNHSPDMEDDGDDDFFKEVYGKEYTGPPRVSKSNSQERPRESKRPLPSEESDGDDEAPDPNAVPTDFTSREAKVWEAKAKAIERNWKKRKEEEMICKICGESGHFTQVSLIIILTTIGHIA